MISQLIVSQINPDAFPMIVVVFNRKIAFCALKVPLARFGFVSGCCWLLAQVPKNQLPSTVIRLRTAQAPLTRWHEKTSYSLRLMICGSNWAVTGRNTFVRQILINLRRTVHCSNVLIANRRYAIHLEHRCSRGGVQINCRSGTCPPTFVCIRLMS